MIRPVVFLCQMAMNESIATTCCYKRVSDNIAEMAVTLHGGVIRDKPYYKYYFGDTAEQIPGMWLDRSVEICPENMETAKKVTSVWKNQGIWYVQFADKDEPTPVTTVDGKVIAGFKTKNILRNKELFFRETIHNIMHIGSTSPHYKYTSGNDWLPDHAAVQYSS